MQKQVVGSGAAGDSAASKLSVPCCSLAGAQFLHPPVAAPVSSGPVCLCGHLSSAASVHPALPETTEVGVPA